MPPRLRISNTSRSWTSTLVCYLRDRPPSLQQLPHRLIQTTTPIIDPSEPIDPLGLPSQQSSNTPAPPNIYKRPSVLGKKGFSPQYHPSRAPPRPSKARNQERQPLILTPAIREQLPLLASQPPFYATIHVHGKPYLITQGDTIRLPFLMHGVRPGDILRLNRVTSFGSRDFTLIGGTPNKSHAQKIDDASMPVIAKLPISAFEPIVGKTEGLQHTPYPASSTDEAGQEAGLKKKGPPSYLDDRFFVCRAVVMGTEAEPMRIKEKTKRRQRHVKTVRSKHKYTVVKVKELGLRSMQRLEVEAEERMREKQEEVSELVGNER